MRFHQLLIDRLAVTIRFECSGEVALVHLNVANPGRDRRDVVLTLRIVLSRLGKPFDDGQGVAERF